MQPLRLESLQMGKQQLSEASGFDKLGSIGVLFGCAFGRFLVYLLVQSVYQGNPSIVQKGHLC